jgi:hypothetical protein
MYQSTVISRVILQPCIRCICGLQRCASQNDSLAVCNNVSACGLQQCFSDVPYFSNLSLAGLISSGHHSLHRSTWQDGYPAVYLTGCPSGSLPYFFSGCTWSGDSPAVRRDSSAVCDNSAAMYLAGMAGLQTVEGDVAQDSVEFLRLRSLWEIRQHEKIFNNLYLNFILEIAERTMQRRERLMCPLYIFKSSTTK